MRINTPLSFDPGMMSTPALSHVDQMELDAKALAQGALRSASPKTTQMLFEEIDFHADAPDASGSFQATALTTIDNLAICGAEDGSIRLINMEVELLLSN